MLNWFWFLFVQEHVDFKYHVSVKNSLRYAIQEMRRQSSLLRNINGLCCSIPEVEGGKVGKLAGHLKEICKSLEKTSIVCEEDLENKCPGWDLHHPPSDFEDNTNPSDVEDTMDGYESEDPEINSSGWPLLHPPSDYENNPNPLFDVEDTMDGYESEDPELWQMVFDDLQWEENKVAVSLREHCRIWGYDYDQIYDRETK